MVSVESIGKGIAKFADREILKNVDGWQKVVVGAAIALAINRSQDIVASYRENSIVKMLKIFDDNGNIIEQAMYGNISNAAQDIDHDFKIKNADTIDFTQEDKLTKIIDNV